MEKANPVTGCFAGIDIGSITAKAALIQDGKLAKTHVIASGYNTRKAAERVFKELLDQANVQRPAVQHIVATGYGRNSVDFAGKAVTEITCHAAGAFFQDTNVRSVIDIGGQDSKAILMDSSGHVLDFIMNDKCAAGTGRFLEVMARALETDLDAFGYLAAKATKAVAISSLCTVFAESEVISLIAAGESRTNIIDGIHSSVAARVSGMALRIALAGPVMMTGGVSLNPGVVRAMENRLGLTVRTTSLAQVNGAVGAALIASTMTGV